MIALTVISFICSTALLIGGMFFQDITMAIAGAALYLGNIYQYTKK